jgi:hypothetical protein
MSLISEKLTDRIDYLPIEVLQLIESYNGIDFNFSDCSINVEEYDKCLPHEIMEKRIHITFEEQAAPKRTVQVSYRKSLNFEQFLEEYFYYKKEAQTSREEFIDEFIRSTLNMRRLSEPEYYEDIISDYMKEYNCDYTEENIRRALRREAEKLYDEEILAYEEVNAIYKDIKTIREKLNIGTELHEKDIDIILAGNIIKGGIFIQNGEVILFKAEVDENNIVNTITLSVYSIPEIAYVTDGNIDYKKLSTNLLTEEDVIPEKSAKIDFNALLVEHDLTELREQPIIAIYRLKDILLSKVLNSDNVNKSIK